MKKKIVFVVIISVIIAVLISISSVLNTVSPKNNYLATTANNNAIMASEIVNEIQYSLRYGKSLNNYYGIEDILDKIRQYCGYAEHIYITKLDGSILYNKDFSGADMKKSTAFFNNVSALQIKNKNLFWIDSNIQNILLPITDKDGVVIAGLGMSYSNDNLDGELDEIVDKLAFSNVIPVLIGVLIFVLLFLIVRHEYKFKKLLAITIPVIIFSSALCGTMSYTEYKKAYTSLATGTADMLSVKIRNDIGSVISKGVEFEMISGFEDYLSDILENTGVIEDISFSEGINSQLEPGAKFYELDGTAGKYIKIIISNKYIHDRLREIILDIIASIVTSIMISAEVIIFILAVITSIGNLRRQRKLPHKKTEDADTLPVGIVRGLFFFFAMFQYMSIAFVPIVMAEIYKPVLGLSYEIAMCIPVTAQIFMSVFSSWICGGIISSKGWRPVAFFGISFMILGAVVAAFSSEPLMFILSQIIFGFGLGCAKTSFDVFGVIAPSSDKIEEYTSNTNASLITGLSCSAALGAVIAGTFGFSGAFIVMAVFGVFVAALLQVFSVNIIQHHSAVKEDKPVSGGMDMKFAYYIVLLIIPYFFMTMYLDYYFPVFADSKAMPTGNIGYVFLLYGISTAYVGTYLCNKLSKSIKTVLFMSCLLFLLGAFMGIFALNNYLALAVAFVLLIGVVDGIMPSLQFRYVFTLDISKQLGISRVLGMEGAFIGIIRAISPLIFGFVMIRGAVGLLVSGIIVMVVAVLFLMLNSRKSDLQERSVAL